MELINNTTKTLRDDLAVEIKQGSRLSVAAACFSIYAFQELKKELQGIEIHFYITDFYNREGKKRKERILYSKIRSRTQFVWNRI